MSYSEAIRANASAMLNALKSSRATDRQRIQDNAFLREALNVEKLEGQRIATIARTIALIIIACLLPFLNWTWSVLYYESILVLFVFIGVLQWRVAKVGRSKMEVLLIMADLALLTFIGTTPNPFLNETVPSAFSYHFNTFQYFFLFLAVSTLAYSWRTVWALGIWTTVIWLGAFTGLVLFGREVPELTEALRTAWPDNPVLVAKLDPNDAQLTSRIEQVVVFLIVTGILALKSWRSNQLLMKQADVAAQRANLSRYFSPNMVDMLASSSHGAGEVRNQDIAVLFTDIVGFTEMAENLPADKVMTALRRYHATIEKAIFDNQGTLDKYLGDGAMATFGTPHTGPDDALNALKAALQITSEMSRSNTEAEAAGDLQFKVSVGVHYGPAILGDIGPQRRLEFAVVGDTVNVASRLEASSRQLSCNIVCSDALAKRINERQDSNRRNSILEGFRRKSALKLRGRKQPISVWYN